MANIMRIYWISPHFAKMIALSHKDNPTVQLFQLFFLVLKVKESLSLIHIHNQLTASDDAWMKCKNIFA